MVMQAIPGTAPSARPQIILVTSLQLSDPSPFLVIKLFYFRSMLTCKREEWDYERGSL